MGDLCEVTGISTDNKWFILSQPEPGYVYRFDYRGQPLLKPYNPPVKQVIHFVGTLSTLPKILLDVSVVIIKRIIHYFTFPKILRASEH